MPLHLTVLLYFFLLFEHEMQENQRTTGWVFSLTCTKKVKNPGVGNGNRYEDRLTLTLGFSMNSADPFPSAERRRNLFLYDLFSLRQLHFTGKVPKNQLPIVQKQWLLETMSTDVQHYFGVSKLGKKIERKTAEKFA